MIPADETPKTANNTLGLPTSGPSGGSPSGGGPDITSAGGWTWQKVPIYAFGGKTPGFPGDKIVGYEWNPVGKDSAAGGGSGRNDALTAANDALNGYLTASQLAEARRTDAFDQFQKIAQFALPEGATTAPGFEAGGPANAASALLGLPNYTPPPIQTTPMNPQTLATAPQIDPQIQAMLAAISGAGGNAAAQAAAKGG